MKDNFSEFYFKENNYEVFTKEDRLLIEQEVISIGLNPKFVSRLLNYLDSKIFLSYGDFDLSVGNEIRQFIQGDNIYVKAVKQKIHDIINKAKLKYIRDIHNKLEKLKVLPKQQPMAPILSGPGLPVPEKNDDLPTQGEFPLNVNKQF